MKAPLLASEHLSSIEPYRVGIGDRLKITPASGEETLEIDLPVEGVLNLPGHPPIPVDGLSCVEIEQALAPMAVYQVEVIAYRSQHVLVAGINEERPPHPFPYQGPETVEQLIRRIDCPSCQHGYRVRVVRKNPDVGGDPQIFAEEYDDRGRFESATGSPLRLMPGDYVYIEEDFGRKGPITRMTDRRLFENSFVWLKNLRLAQANYELDAVK